MVLPSIEEGMKVTAEIIFFPVDNGDMTLIELNSGRKILIDINIRQSADDPNDDTPDVASMLRDRLDRDSKGRLYVDAFLLSHPDQDHCSGLKRHFHLGPTDDCPENKILIREIWSSPMVFRRASKKYTLCDDAKAFNAEARRRVRRFREIGTSISEGDRILILGEDEDGKTDDLNQIIVQVDENFSQLSGENDESFEAHLIAPLPKSTDEMLEDKISKNKSSTIIRFSLAAEGFPDRCRYLTGGDAEVEIWERVWERKRNNPDLLSYDLLQSPHHCSWRSLSHDSWSECGENARVSLAARNSLSQARTGAIILASSKAILDDNNDPPCIRAKREYESIVNECGGDFRCVADEDKKELIIEVGAQGPRFKTQLVTSINVVGSGAVGKEPLSHG